MIGDFVHRSNIVSRLLIAASLAVPASALARPLQGNPYRPSNGDGPLRPLATRSVKRARTAAPRLRGCRRYAVHQGSFFKGISSLMPNLMISDAETSDLIASIPI
jgi:hypothetical protein